MRPWIKFHTTALDDVRLLRLNERQQLRYFQMYLLAGRLNMDGLFIENNEPLNETDIAIKLRITDKKQFITDFKALKNARLIKANGHGPYIAAFLDEQVDWSKLQEQNRERQAKSRERHEKVTRDKNVTDKKSRTGNALVTPLDQDQTKTKIKKETKTKKKTTTTLPSSSSKPAVTRKEKASKPLVAGGGFENASNDESVLAEIQKQNPRAAESIRIMRPILTSSGLGKKKFNDLMLRVATRILPSEAKRLSLAALASAYADDDVDNKPVVAAYRIENEQVPVQFMNENTWRVIPDAVLKAAGVVMEQHHDDPIRKVSNAIRSARA